MEDVFADLGSGGGKVPLQVYLTTAISRALGVELAAEKHKAAELARARLAEAK